MGLGGGWSDSEFCAPHTFNQDCAKQARLHELPVCIFDHMTYLKSRFNKCRRYVTTKQDAPKLTELEASINPLAHQGSHLELGFYVVHFTPSKREICPTRVENIINKNPRVILRWAKNVVLLTQSDEHVLNLIIQA